MGSNSAILTPPQKTIQDREKNYGPFTGVAEIDQQIKLAFRQTPNWKRLAPDQQLALEMIAHKIARILNGNPNYSDSWHDIAGYATRVESRLDGSGTV